MRIYLLSLIFAAGLPSMAVAQRIKEAEKIAPPTRVIEAEKSWIGKVIVTTRQGIELTKNPQKGAESVATLDGIGTPYVVLARHDNMIQVGTWYEVKGWLHVADSELEVNAIRRYTALIRANPKEPTFYVQRGIAWRSEKEFDVAIMDFSEASRLRPNDPNVHVQRGIAWSFKGNNDRAANDFDSAIRLDRTIAQAYYYRAHSMREKWQGKGVVEKLVQKWKCTKDSKTATAEEKLKALKDLDIAKTELEAARRDYDETLRHEPNAADAVRRYRALVQERLDKIR